MKRPFTLWILVFWLLFLALGGLYGGIAMLLDPSGSSLQMTDVLSLLPVSNYILPGLFLLFVMGLAPLFLVYVLFAQPDWPWVASLFRQSKTHWAWAGTIALGVVLVVWLAVQGLLIGFKWPIQYITALNGFMILLFALSPSVRKFCAIHRQ